MVSDQKTYNNEEYDTNPVVEDVRLDYIRLFTHTKNEIISKKLETQQIAVEDKFFNPGWFGEEKQTIYALKEADFETDSPSGVKFGLIIFAETTGILSSRNIYNFLDFLGDVGGLLEALKLISGLFLSLVSVSGLRDWLIFRLFLKVPSTKLIQTMNQNTSYADRGENNDKAKRAFKKSSLL